VLNIILENEFNVKIYASLHSIVSSLFEVRGCLMLVDARFDACVMSLDD
jgi:hypothetical protein